MAKFRLDSIGELARQLQHFTPPHARAAQVAAAESFLHDVDPAKAYPLELVVYRVTGYRRRTEAESPELLTGLALQHDLGLLIETVSAGLDASTAALAEPVLSIEDVCERFNVTSKTIQRWRRRGLPARKFLFPDGKRRVGFLLSSVEQFFDARRDQVVRGASFSQVGEAERDEIVRRARRLAMQCHCCVGEIVRRVARRTGRSPVTVLHTIRKHDADHREHSVFAAAAAPLEETDRARIVRAYRRGVPVRVLARRLCRPMSAVYRAILDERVQRLAHRKIKFIDDPLYHQPDAEGVIDALVAQPGEITAPGDRPAPEETRVPRDLPPYLAALYRTPLLTPARERALFLKFHFHKMQFALLRRRLDPQLARMRDLGRLEAHLRKATETKNQIVAANLRLVVSIARRHLRSGLSLMELVSDGNLTLMRAAESYDVHRGHRFSTYATLALMKGFARSVPQMMAAGRRGAGGRNATALQDVPDWRQGFSGDRFIDREHVRQMLTRLEERERTVVAAHYGLDEDGSAPATYAQLGKRLGLSKARVRQIEQGALRKLRALP